MQLWITIVAVSGNAPLSSELQSDALLLSYKAICSKSRTRTYNLVLNRDLHYHCATSKLWEMRDLNPLCSRHRLESATITLITPCAYRIYSDSSGKAKYI